MTDRIVRGIPAAAAAAFVALGASSPAALASSGMQSHCDEIADSLPKADTPTLSLTIQLADHGLIDAESDMDAPASDPSTEEVPAPALTDAGKTTASADGDEVDIEEPDDAARKTPETAVHLPGVSAEDQPRFRRQMYRTDI